MGQLRTGDPWVDAHQMQPEELLAEARVFAAQRAILRAFPRPRRAGWSARASALVTIGRRLLVGLLGNHAVASPKGDA
jgi:hypothetical protein